MPGLKKQFGFVEEKPVLEHMGGSGRSRRLSYRRYVEEGLLREIESPWEAGAMADGIRQ